MIKIPKPKSNHKPKSKRTTNVRQHTRKTQAGRTIVHRHTRALVDGYTRPLSNAQVIEKYEDVVLDGENYTVVSEPITSELRAQELAKSYIGGRVIESDGYLYVAIQPNPPQREFIEQRKIARDFGEEAVEYDFSNTKRQQRISPTYSKGDTVSIKGIDYILVSEPKQLDSPPNKKIIYVKRPRGKNTYVVFQNDYGNLSDPINVSGFDRASE